MVSTCIVTRVARSTGGLALARRRRVMPTFSLKLGTPRPPSPAPDSALRTSIGGGGMKQRELSSPRGYIALSVRD
ncbi:unnamed protein product [Arctia plantaginis]|uniref:Uncharacterized protein n=1 Tax=Arctia plantaginis TaxID=874455 RepID=A0A8S1AT44_ARCPL|nr:unnamed protein product [Arctia plantaginis]